MRQIRIPNGKSCRIESPWGFTGFCSISSHELTTSIHFPALSQGNSPASGRSPGPRNAKTWCNVDVQKISQKIRRKAGRRRPWRRPGISSHDMGLSIVMGISHKNDGLWSKIPIRWMIWGHPHFRKPPHGLAMKCDVWNMLEEHLARSHPWRCIYIW